MPAADRARNRRSSPGTLLCAIVASGCATAAASWRRSAAPPDVDVFFATDRRPRDPAAEPCQAGLAQHKGLRFGSEQGTTSLSFGLFPVRLPVGQRLGETPPTIERPACPPRTHPVYLDGPIPESQEEFIHSIGMALTRARTQELLVFVHGYNFAFDEAVLWAAQFKHDVHFEGVLVLYSWPSAGSRWAYPGDSSSADWTTPHLARFLDMLTSSTKGVPIHLLAHSMGNRAALGALHAL